MTFLDGINRGGTDAHAGGIFLGIQTPRGMVWVAVLALCSGVAACGGDSVCGDGVTEGAELCDDGNQAAGDGCSSSCDIEIGWECTEVGCAPDCGDGLVVGGEVCDWAAITPVHCSLDCAQEMGRCGDGIWQPSFEECDLPGPDLRGCVGCSESFGFDCEGEPMVCIASGLSGSLVMGDLTAADRETFCAWMIAIQGGVGAVFVCGSLEFTNYSVQECADNVGDIGWGICTVADLEDHAALSGDRCTWMLSSDPPCMQ